MQDWNEFGARVAKAMADSAYWNHIIVWYPTKPESVIGVAIVFLLSAALLIALYLMFVSRFQGQRLKVRFRDYMLGGFSDPEQSNIVQVRLSTAKTRFPHMYAESVTGKTYPGVLLLTGRDNRLRKVTCRVLLNQAFEEDTLLIHRKLAAQLGMSADVADDEEWEVDIRWPLWRLDKRTFNSPDRDIKLQYRIGAIFLVLGIIVPKLFDSVLAVANAMTR